MTDAGQPVQVASMQTLQRRRLPPADIVIIDEAHRWFRFLGDWMNMPEWQRVPFVGLSATPWTKGLGKHYDHLIVAATTAELIEKGFLSPFRAYAPAHPDLSGVEIVAGDFHEGQLAEAMSQPGLVADTVTTWLRLGEDRPTLCFAVDRAHARKLADEFEAAGIPTGYVDALTPADERERIGRRLREGQIKVVCNVYCLTTGVDWDVRCIILARPTKSEILYTQIIGRGLRIAEGKTDCLILDHSDSTLRLGFRHRHPPRDARRREAQEVWRCAKGKPPPLPKECPSARFLSRRACTSARAAGSCPSASPRSRSATANSSSSTASVRTRPRHHRTRAGSLLDAAVGPAGSRITSPATPREYKARYGHWPRGLAESLLLLTRAFLNWLKSQEIAFHRRRQKEARVRHEPLRIAHLAGGAGILTSLGVPARRSATGMVPARSAAARTASGSTTRAAAEPGFVPTAAPATASSWSRAPQNVEFKEAARANRTACWRRADYRLIETPSPDRPAEARRDERALEAVAPDHARRSRGPVPHARTGLTTFPAALRFSPDERYAEVGKRPSWHPVMVARSIPLTPPRPKAERAALHRTYLVLTA